MRELSPQSAQRHISSCKRTSWGKNIATRRTSRGTAYSQMSLLFPWYETDVDAVVVLAGRPGIVTSE